MNITEIYDHKIHERYNDLILSEKEIDNPALCKIFEYYTCIELTKEFNQPFYEYSDIDPNFKELHQMSKNDTGIDCCNLIDTIVQCKLRKNSLTWSEVSTFFGSNLSFCDEQKKLTIPWPNLMIARNSDSSLSQNLKVKSNLFTDKVYDKSKMIKYCETLLENPPQLIKEKSDIQLRDYQIEVIDLIKNSGNIVICLPTGCGKNFIIINSLGKDQKYLILVPLRLLMEQLKQEIINHTSFTKNDIQFIGDNYKTFNDEKLITICVFNSINIITKYNQFSKIFIDEAHHIYKPNIYKDESIFKDKIESYVNVIQSLSKYNNNVYLSATIDKIETFKFYKKDLRDMIDHGYLTDYTINVPVFNDDPNHENIAKYLIQNYRTIIIYTSTSKEGKAFSNTLNKLQPNCSKFIDCRTSKINRLDILTRYKNEEIPFLVNVQILTEGFDAPCTNGVLFLHMPNSKTKLVQIMGRALRLYPFKKYASIILPYSIDEDIKSISKFLSIIATNDARINKTFTNKIYGGYIDINKISIDNDNNNVELRYELIYNNIGKLFEPIDEEAEWKLLFKDLINHFDTFNAKPKIDDKNPYISKLCRFLNDNVYRFNNDNTEIINIWTNAVNDPKYHTYLITKEDLWKYHFNYLIQYEADNHTLPGDKVPLGKWKNNQNCAFNINKEGLVVTDPELNKLWNDFINNEKYEQYFSDEKQWIYRMNSIYNYIEIHNKLPPSTVKDPDTKSKGMWLNTQTTNYNYKKKSMENPVLVKLWEKFIIFKSDYKL